MKIRIVNLDFYMSNSIPGLDIQYSEFRGSSVYHVPVIRIYGSTEEGEKICLHVHGVFPYIYIPYDGQIGVDGFMYQIALGLDKAINISLGQASSNTQHVYKVCLISGIPFYGYHARQHQYLKIYFYNPLIIKKACTLLQNGNILGKIYQPHEAHIPYILQFMIDYNLHGMSFINVSDLKYRADDYTTRKYPENTVLPPSVRKMSVCKIEADTKTECILNREEITPGRLAVNPGIKALWDDEKQRRRNNKESSQMEQFLTQNRIDKPPTSTHIAYKKMLDEKLRLKPKLTGISPELELSVYPAETPPDSNLLNASTIDVTSSQNTDDSMTITNESILDEDGRELYDLLQDLKEDNIEKDSVLSQVQKEDESDGENDIDLSLPLDVNLQTPRKIEEIPEMEFLNDSYFETLGKLPQLDGVCDDLDAQPRKRKIKKNKTDGKNNIKAENLKDWDLGLDNDYFLNLIPNKENIKDKSYYLGNTCEMRKRSSKKTFKVKTSAIFCKSKLKFAKIQCNYCFKSHPKTQRCIKSYFRKDEEEQINDVIGKICQDINAEELKWEKRLDIEKVVEDICQNLTIEKRSKSKKLSKKLSCSYCPSDKQKQHDVVTVDVNQNLLTETSVSEGKKGLNENKSNKRGRRKKTVKKVVETTIIEENFNLDPHEEKITVKNGIKPLPCVLGKVKRSRKKKNLINDDKTNRQLGLSLSDKDPPIPDIKIRKNCIKKTSQASTPLNMPSLCDSNECNNIDDIEDNNNNINMVNLNNAASAECLLASEQPNLPLQQGRYNLRSRKPKPPKPPADLPKIPIEKSKTKSKPKRSKQSKNKQTQTLNLSAKSKRKPATKPLFNIIVTKTQKIDSYNIKVCPIKKDGKPCDYYELGPNPKPKFRVIAGKKPYTFNVKNTSAKYPNTTWSSYYKPQNLESNSIKNDDNNSIKIISNQILENAEKYCETEIKKGAIIDTIKIEPKKLDRLTSQEEKAVDALTELYDEIQGEIFPQIDVPEIFESLNIGDETTDGAPPAPTTSSNSLSNYREDMKRTYDNLMEKMGRSLNDLFDNISPVRRSSRIQKDLSRKKDAETKQKNVSFNDVCSVRSYHSESLYLFDDDEMEMIDDKAPAPSKSERKPLISLDRQAPIKQKVLPSELDSDKSKDGLSVASRTNKGRKRKTKKKNTKENKLIYPVNQYASLDGPNDSSSDDDQPVRPAAKRRCVQPRKPLSESLKYSPLKVHYGSPTKSTDLQKQVNRSPISFTDQDKKETSKKFKRKLSFSRKTFNKTQSEEKLTCVYRSNKKTSLNIVSIPTPIPESTINLTQNESNLSLITPYQKPRQTSTALIDTTPAEKENEKLSLSLITPYQREQVGDETFPEDDREDPTNNGLDLGLLVPTIQTLEPSNCASTASEVETNVSDGCREQSGVSLITPYQKVDVKFIKNYDREFSDSSASLSDDIFSPNLPNSSEIFTFDDEPNGDRDPAKLYDVLNNYIPQAGTSKLTGSSVESVTPKQLSSNSIETIASVDNRSSENDVITPYQKEIAPLSVFEFANRNHRTGPISIIPKIPPPSRKLIEDNLRDYDIPEVYHREAFYSNAKDVTGPVEIGVKVLRILSDKIGDLPEFESSFKGIDYYRREYLEQIYPDDKITIKDINNYKKSFCKISNCVIRPAELPPTKGEVKIWLKNKLESDKDKSTRIIEKKKRILIPCSPGNDQDDDSDDSLTISPCTPLDETLKNVPQQDESPVIKRNEALKRYRKRKSQIHSSEDSSGKSLELTKEKRHDSCQITGVTLDDLATSCDNLQKARAVSEYLNLTVFCMELIVETRNNYNPDPSHDVIKGIIYQIFNDIPEDDPLRKRSLRGCFLLDNMNTSPTKGKFSILDGIIIDDDDVIKIVKSEAELITQFVEFFIEIDPDILIGYEIEMLSWGYLIERGYVLNLNLISLLSRVPISTKNKPEDDQADLTIPGRIILDFWRLLRHEIALQSYTFENIVYHILHQRAPLYSFKTLTNWWNHTSGLYRNKVLRYYYYRIDAILKIIERLDLIGRTSELAKLFGIQFFEVLSRGSQFRVESMMLRLAKPLNYIAVSPNVQQRAKMRAPESLPLIMEPESKFYVDPVIVLDFQSLYPSMIIAYNYCFSTCLGRIEHLGQNIPFEFGATHLKIPRKYVKNLSRKDLINISPCGVGYVKKTVREGILPKMLQEILDTRLMVKKSLKKNSGNKILERVLDARQLGLKLIANVTYGYTAANFSGRMPCIEVGDSVVSKGRETLQRAINLVEKTAEWGARVVYGDTDSLFVLIPGRSRQEAFRIGAKIAEAVTEDNPSPVKLKLEKIFHPCILQTKKRYVGYMFESPDQVEPEYCAKGIETVRRDGCPAVSKMLEKCLKILFDTRDVSLVRQYVVRQFSKILTGRISIQDLTFAKEYRGASNYRPGACVPALELARKWIAVDKRSEPRRKERVPYVIINGPPGLPLIKLVRSPRELIADPSLRPNALYYITKVIIPPINRCFLLIGADVNHWFNDMPRKQYTSYQHNSSPVKGKKSTISQYFSTRNCAICAKQSKDGLCDSCLLKPQSTSAVLHEKIRVLEQNYFCIKKICELCCCTSDKVMCISLDCPVYYKRVQINKEIEQTPFFRELIAMLPSLDF